MNGSIIGAELWRLDANDEKTGDVIASLSHTMGEDVEGYFGLLSGRPCSGCAAAAGDGNQPRRN